VTRGEVDAQIRQNILLWVGCVAGALEESEYRDKLMSAGFEEVEIEPTRIYRVADARRVSLRKRPGCGPMAPQVDGKFMSAFVRATKSKSAKTTEAVALRLAASEGKDPLFESRRDGHASALQRFCSCAREFGTFIWPKPILNAKASLFFTSLQRGKSPRRGGVRPEALNLIELAHLAHGRLT